jgi:hypothetical protein
MAAVSMIIEWKWLFLQQIKSIPKWKVQKITWVKEATALSHGVWLWRQKLWLCSMWIFIAVSATVPLNYTLNSGMSEMSSAKFGSYHKLKLIKYEKITLVFCFGWSPKKFTEFLMWPWFVADNLKQDQLEFSMLTGYHSHKAEENCIMRSFIISKPC